MISPLLYYILVLPLAYLPMPILYGLSSILSYILIHIFPYRKAVIEDNIKRSFPDKSPQEHKKIRDDFYRHFADVLVESVKNIVASKRFLKSHIQVENPELLDAFYKDNRSVILVSGHFNNWEYMISSQNFLLKHQAVGIGMPMTNKFWDKAINNRRSRFGMRVIHSNNVRQKFEEWKNEATATLVLADQSPGDSLKSYWMNFLKQDTAVLFGTEMLARKYNLPVVFFEIRKLKRGKYTIVLSQITDNPNDVPYGFITEQHTQKLEKLIVANPEQWIWSHKRWKREVPENLEQLRENQKSKFLAKQTN